MSGKVATNSLSMINTDLETVNLAEISKTINEVMVSFKEEFKNIDITASHLKYSGFDINLIKNEIHKIAKDRPKAEVAADLTTICMLAVMRGNNIEKVIQKASNKSVEEALRRVKASWDLRGPAEAILTPRTLTPIRVSLAMWQITLACASKNPSPNVTDSMMWNALDVIGVEVLRDKNSAQFMIPKFIMTNAYTSCSPNCLTNLHKIWLILNNINISGNTIDISNPTSYRGSLLASWMQISKFYEQAIAKPIQKDELIEAIKLFSTKNYNERVKDWANTEEAIGRGLASLMDDQTVIARASEIKAQWTNNKVSKGPSKRSSRGRDNASSLVDQ